LIERWRRIKDKKNQVRSQQGWGESILEKATGPGLMIQCTCHKRRRRLIEQLRAKEEMAKGFVGLQRKSGAKRLTSNEKDQYFRLRGKKRQEERGEGKSRMV